MKFLLFFLLLSHSLFAFSLKEKFEKAEPGTYVVTEQNQMTSILHLHSTNGEKILFEEISIPSHQAQALKWTEWVSKGAPGHSSWILYEVDLSNKSITECYSLTRKAWISTTEMDAFLIPLLSLNLKHLSDDERIQRGKTPTPGKVDRKPWGPPQVINGEKIHDPVYDVYQTTWPQDSSDLAGKQIVLYFDRQNGAFPFPYWMQAREGALKFKIRAIDSGSGMISSVTDIPRRRPIFKGGTKHEKGVVSLSLNIPTYYDDLKLYAVDTTESPRLTHVLPFEINRKQEKVTLSIDEGKLASLFSNEHEYLWILASEKLGVVVECPHLFKWISRY